MVKEIIQDSLFVKILDKKKLMIDEYVYVFDGVNSYIQIFHQLNHRFYVSDLVNIGIFQWLSHIYLCIQIFRSLIHGFLMS